MTDLLDEHAAHTCQHCRTAEGTHRLGRHVREWVCLDCVTSIAAAEGWGRS